MSDDIQAVEPENADTPEGTGNVEQPEVEAVDWEKRYKDVQSEYTRTNQEAKQLRGLFEALQSDDADARLAAAQAIGLEFADDEDDTQYADPLEKLSEKVQQLEGHLTERQQHELQEREVARIEAHVDAQLDAIEGLDKADHDWIVSRAVALPATPDGMPDIQGAHQEFVAWTKGQQARWQQSKRAPHISAVGTAGSPALPTDATHQQRVDFMLERLQADQ
jgi:hypothetical protein